MPTQSPVHTPSARERPRQTTLLVVAAALAAAALGFESIRHGWLPPLTAYAWFGALELAVVAFTLGLMRRAVARRALELAGAQADLRAATKVNALLASVAQHMPNAVIISDREGQILWTNAACDKMSGFPHDETVRQPLAEFMGAIINGLSTDETQLLLERGTRAAIVSKDTAADGRVRWFSITFQPVHNAGGDLVNFIVLIDDFTAVREAHQRQRHSEEIAIQVSRMAQVGAWEYLVASHEMRWEPELYRICQVELGHRPTLETMAGFFPEEQAAGFLGNVRTAVVEGRAFDMECPLVTALGNRRWVQVFGWPEVDAAKAIRLVGTLQDTTARHAAESERRTMEGQLFQLQKMETLGALAGGIAHDFNNLLTGMIGNQDLALEDLAPDHPARTRLEEARKATLLACELVEQILTFSRETGAERVSTDLATVIEEARRFLRASVPTTIQIEVRIGRGCGRVLADVAQLNQLILNLGSNGAYAMRATGGVLGISLQPTVMTATQAAAHGNLPLGPYVRLTVRDTGHGMDAETQRRIFTPFFTTKAGDRGTGLGLAIVQGIVRAHGGGIDVSSSPGEGTSVDVYLPVAALADAEPFAEPQLPPRRGSGEMICIVDDEQVVAQTTQITLERLGYRTQVFNSPGDCLAALEAGPGDCALLLTDQTMPEMDGIELSRRVRAIAPRMPIVIMSGYFSRISPAMLEQLGRVLLLAKPFRSADVARILEQALEPGADRVSSPQSG